MYAEAEEERILIRTQVKMKMLSWFYDFRKSKELYNKENVFMIIVSLQQEDEDEDSAWTGSVSMIAKQNEKSTQKLQKEVTKNINKLRQDLLSAVKSSSSPDTAEIKAKVEGVEAKIVSVKDSVEAKV